MASRKRIIISLFVICILAGGGWAATHFGRAYCLQREVSKADEESKKGFWALAYDRLEPYRKQLTSNEKDCNLLLNTFANAKKGERLEWAAQACLESKIETFGVYLSIAIAHELQGHDQDAVRILNEVSAKFDKEPTALLRMANIFIRNKDEPKAAEAMLQAANRTEDPQVRLDTIPPLLRQKRVAEALKLAIPLREIPTENPEVRLIVARALIAGHEPSGGVKQINEARFLMMKLSPERKAQLENDYADVLKSGGKAISM